MASLQNYNAIQLYRECLRQIRCISGANKKQHAEPVVDMVRQMFKSNMHEKSPKKIQKFKDNAAKLTVQRRAAHEVESTARILDLPLQ